MEVFVTKGFLMELLQADSLKFYQFLNNESEECKAISRMYNDMSEINLNSNVIKYFLIPLLVGYSILSQETVDNINSYILSKTSV